MTMREKMAMEMAQKDGKHWAPMSEMFREAYYNHADAALAAMEEPTEAMFRTGDEKYQDGENAYDIFRAMIGVARGGG